MDSLPDQFPLSLRAWPSSDVGSNALRSQIARIHTQRGNFRNISEELLEKEINAAEAEDLAKEEADSSDDDEEEEKQDPEKELNAAKEKIFLQVSQALRSSEYAVDFISLLLSKFNPNAALSMSATFRNPGPQNIPIGTVGADKVDRPGLSGAQKLQNRRVTKGWKILSLNRSVESILGAAKRLEQEMEAEAKYWEDVLSIKEKGWAVCYATKTSQYDRQDNKKSDGTLAVRFGFSESAPEFRDRGLAILRRTDDGSIALGTDVLQTTPKRLQVGIEKDGVQSGHSVFSLFQDLDDSIQSQVLKARNAIFEQELWHELLRESRGLVAYGVIVHDSSISVPLSSSKTVLLKFTADSDELSSLFSTNEDSNIANAICIAIHLLLSYSHRQRLRQRSQPPPPLSLENNLGNLPTRSCNLLRPVIANLYHQAAISSLRSLLLPITTILISAGFSSSYTVGQKPSLSAENRQNRYQLANQQIHLPQSVSEKLIDSLVDNIQGQATLTIQDNKSEKGAITFTIEFRTIMFPAAATQYRVLGASESFKAPPVFPEMSEVREYLLFAASCALAEFFTKSPESEESEKESGNNTAGNTANHQAESRQTAEGSCWHTTAWSNVIRQAIPNTNEVREVSFTFENVNTTPPEKAASITNAPALFPSNKENEKLCLRVDRKYKYKTENEQGENRRTGGTSVWGANGEETRSLREVAEGVMLSVPIRLPSRK